MVSQVARAYQQLTHGRLVPSAVQQNEEHPAGLSASEAVHRRVTRHHTYLQGERAIREMFP
jgi:hypothetical protein